MAVLKGMMKVMIEADVQYPTDAGLAGHGVRVLAREAKKLAKLLRAEFLVDVKSYTKIQAQPFGMGEVEIEILKRV